MKLSEVFVFHGQTIMFLYHRNITVPSQHCSLYRVYYSGTRRGVLSWEPRLQWSGVQQQGWALEGHSDVIYMWLLVHSWLSYVQNLLSLLNFHSTHMTPRIPKEPQLKELLKTFFHMPFIWWYYDLPISAKEIDHLG